MFNRIWLKAVTTAARLFILSIAACYLLINFSVFAFANANSISAVTERLSLDEDWHSGTYREQGVTYTPQPTWVQSVPVSEPDKEPTGQLADGIFHLLLDNQYRVSEGGEQSKFNRYVINYFQLYNYRNNCSFFVQYSCSYFFSFSCNATSKRGKKCITSHFKC